VLYLAFQVVPRNTAGLFGDPVRSDYALIQPNDPPLATNVAYTGTLEVFNPLFGTYDYQDNEGDGEQGTIYQWFTADDALGTNQQQILGAVAQVLPLPESAEGLYVAFAVTPRDSKGQFGAQVFSAWDGPIAPAIQPYSPEATAVFDRMPVELPVETKDKWAVFIDAEALNGNYYLLDDFWFFVDNYADNQPLDVLNALTRVFGRGVDR
jgi:hypothetical protein